MRDGRRVFDADTHGLPCSEVLEPYLDASVRQRVPDLDRYKAPMKVGFAGEIRQEPFKHMFRFGDTAGWVRDEVRVLGDAGPREGTERRWQKFMGTRFPTEGGLWDPHVRVEDMDAEGVDVQLVVSHGTEHPDPEVEIEFFKAEHRFLDDFCGAYPHRLKSMLVASARCVDESVKEIKRWAGSPWAVAVRPVLPLDFPIDHPDLDPIWKAADEAGLCIVHHSFAWGYPWARRLDDQVEYVGYVAEGMKHKPSEYMAGGRFFCSIVIHEGQEMVDTVNRLLGDHILMFGSDYPHSESRFPGSVDEVLGWNSLSEDALQRLFWNNPVRAFGEP